MTLTADRGAAGVAGASHPALTRRLTLADATSLLNGAIGLAATCAAARVRSGDPSGVAHIGIMLLICVVCDVVDGVLARSRGASRWGAMLDSCADLVSFGAVPSVLILAQTGSAIPVARRLAALAFGLAALLRLVRFAKRPRHGDAFEGLPTTAAAASVLALVVLRPPDVLEFVGVVVLAGLMISGLPFPKVRGTLAVIAATFVLMGGLLLISVGVHQTWSASAARTGALLELAAACAAPLCARPAGRPPS